MVVNHSIDPLDRVPISRPRHARHTQDGDRQSDRGYRVDH
jgi:hypothetical protein